ncbi:COP9 signalosome (CSN) subunit [Linderina macrospora]|uniref:COP9 signalosome (CSN) subunit n=1 Tax=Linderina macrospora TaxID=4868 RepID=A0ACC1J7V2_9FUNG|nr:COP9 signalosome (CSN) subunit [Linderina macrospora]
MADTRLNKALYKFKALKATQNAQELAQIVRIESAYSKLVLDDIYREDGGFSCLFAHNPRTLWEDMSLCHFRASAEFCTGNYVEAYSQQKQSFDKFNVAFQRMTRWAVPTLLAMCQDLCMLARRADRQLAAQGMPVGKLEDATRAVNTGLSSCMIDREPDPSKSRKWGMYRLANLLLAAYFHLRAYNMCNSTIKAITASDMPSLDLFPMSDQVMFRYYRGVLAFRDERYGPAKEDLLFALQHCLRGAYRNRTRILSFLVPIQMMEGTLPNRRLLQKYPVIDDLYGGMVTAIRHGNLRAFDQALQAQEWRLVQLGTFMAAERVRPIAVRGLLRKTYLIGGKAPHVRFSKFQAAFEACDLSLDMSEVECTLADMIAKGYVKGYMSQSHATVVLSKVQPFPPLSSVHKK